ncbi:MAG: hypothetical protein Kow0098_10900 [Ignavibacteriaceae bacterium]
MSDDDKKKDDNLSRIYREVGPYLGLGLQLAVTVTAMVLLGVWLDNKFDLSPLLTILFSAFGIFAGLYNFIKSASSPKK